MVLDIGRIESWNASKHTGTIYSDATHKSYTVDKSAFGRIPREPIVGDIVTIDSLVPRSVNKVETARIRGLVPKKSNFGTILGVILRKKPQKSTKKAPKTFGGLIFRAADRDRTGNH